MKLVGDALRAAGLHPRALAAWAGTDRASALPERLPALAAVDPVPAATALSLFVAGAELPAARVRLPLDELVAHGLVERRGDAIRATVAIVPIGPSLVVCDRDDARAHRELVAWPDDSSYHLAGAIPGGRVARWIDLGAGSAFAQLARPALAETRLAVDLNPRAVAHARLGAALSGVELTAHCASIADHRDAPAALVTCNAPMLPDPADPVVWRRADPELFDALWPAIRALLAPGGLAVIHAMTDAIPPDLPGERVVVGYAPGFAVLWWRPDAAARLVTAQRALTADRPHIDARDRDDAIARC
ncbi:MAG TPA: hypothetical protein VFQ53_21445 [Kofleriaceae bacterium]|nr:hypothetical protein [Kofleriaceae bacterium]